MQVHTEPFFISDMRNINQTIIIEMFIMIH